MNIQTTVDLKNLHPLEIRLLRFARERRGTGGDRELLDAALLEGALGFNVGQANQAFSWLLAKGLVEEAKRTSATVYELTERGLEYRKTGTVEERMLALLAESGPLTLPAVAERLAIENRDVGSAFGGMAKEGLVELDAEKRAVLKAKGGSERIRLMRSLLDRAADKGALVEEELDDAERAVVAEISKKRGSSSSPFRTAEREKVFYRVTDGGLEAARGLVEAGLTGEEVGALTPEMLASGAWREAVFRRYNIDTPPSRVAIGRRNPYAEYIQWVKDKLVSAGFEEFDGPLVETEFWNGDALFMPQFHSARDIHDVYYVKSPERAREIEQPWLDRVARAHENGADTGSKGWRYSFDRDFTRRLILRSQGTVLSAKQLPKAKVPGKYFGIVRCFRYDKVDATHGADFYQTEGIVLGKDVNLRTLLGLLKMFAEEVAGATEVRYVPGYFPFTEPSIEVHIRHPELGWFELGGSGIFRPEVSLSLGVEVPVLAWGLGIDRMALLQLGLSDLRELFTGNLESVRMRKRKGNAEDRGR